MKRSELKARLLNGETLDHILPFRAGQSGTIYKGGTIYKAAHFTPDDEILYIPDVYLNGLIFDKSLKGRERDIQDILQCCYTGEDFIDEALNNQELAERLFCIVNWQHPNSALNELANEKPEAETPYEIAITAIFETLLAMENDGVISHGQLLFYAKISESEYINLALTRATKKGDL